MALTRCSSFEIHEQTALLPTSLPTCGIAAVRNLELGESGDVSVTAQYKNSAGRWVAAPRPQKATRWKARVYVRGHDGIRQEIVRFGRTRREAEATLEAAVAAVLRGADAVINPTMPLSRRVSTGQADRATRLGAQRADDR